MRVVEWAPRKNSIGQRGIKRQKVTKEPIVEVAMTAKRSKGVRRIRKPIQVVGGPEKTRRPEVVRGPKEIEEPKGRKRNKRNCIGSRRTGEDKKTRRDKKTRGNRKIGKNKRNGRVRVSSKRTE